MQYQAIILAAGNSSRSKLAYNKVLHKIDDKEIIYHAAINFINDNRCDSVFLVCKKQDVAIFKTIFSQQEKIVYVIGGDTRQQSVANALKFITSQYVLIHDGARPHVSKELIDKIVISLQHHKAIVPALCITDTVKKIKGNKIVKTLNREELVVVQTPQGFDSNLLKTAHINADNSNYSDDAVLIELFTDEDVYIVDGEKSNKKWTTKEDF